jgi:hypothetical protein
MLESAWVPPFVTMVTYRNTFEVVFATYDVKARDDAICICHVLISIRHTFRKTIPPTHCTFEVVQYIALHFCRIVITLVVGLVVGRLWVRAPSNLGRLGG